MWRPPTDHPDDRADRALDPFVLRQVEDRADEPLPRRADQHGPTQVEEQTHPAHQLEVLVEVLAEPDPRIHRDPVGGDPRELGRLDPLAEVLVHLTHDVVVPWSLLHRLRVALHVHQDEGGLPLADHVEHLRIDSARDVVHDRGSGVQCRGRHVGLPGVDRDGDGRMLLDEPLDHRPNAAQLLLRRDGLGARAGRLAADVQDVRTVVDHLGRMRHRGGPIEEPSAVGERVRGDVQDPHDERALGAVERTIADPPDGTAHPPIVSPGWEH